MSSQTVALVVAALLVGGAVGWFVARLRVAAQFAASAAQVAGLTTERDLLRERITDLQQVIDDEDQVGAALVPLRDTIARVERQVGALERDRAHQYGELGAQLEVVAASTVRLGEQTSSLVGSLQSSSIRGAWGETQLRRLLEHAGMLARCDFAEQVQVSTPEGRPLRPDVVVRLPGDKSLVIDAKAPMTKFLAAQAPDLAPTERAGLLAAHARAVRGHVTTLTDKAYWSAFTTTPEFVVCFVPTDAMLAAALDTDPSLYDDAASRHVVLASPATLLALLRTVAFTWQQDSLAGNARELLVLGRELYGRLGTLAGHTSRLGASLTRSVEAYNAMVGSLESRVLVTARRMHELGLVTQEPPQLEPVETATRPLTTAELLDALDEQVGRPEIDPAEASTHRHTEWIDQSKHAN